MNKNNYFWSVKIKIIYLEITKTKCLIQHIFRQIKFENTEILS